MKAKRNPRGSGRKPAGNIRLVVYVKPGTLAAIAALQTAALKTPGQVLDAQFVGRHTA